MKVTFLSNAMTPHQVPLSEALWEKTGQQFSFLETIAPEELPIGWKNTRTDLPFLLSLRQQEDFRQQTLAAHAAIFGAAPEEMILPRLKAGKLTFRYSERFYKTGTPLRRAFRDALAAWLHHGRYQKYPLFLLCASAYTAADAARFGNYKNRTYKWGYFPETKHYDTAELMEGKTPTEILWAGRFLDWKHPDDAIRVAEKLKADGLSFCLNLIGTGELEETLRHMIAEKGLTDCVQLLGSMPPEQVRQHMEKAGIFLFTSDRYEGWGAVLNESMNSGCAVVASHAIGSVPYLVKDGQNGIIYRSGDVESLYQKTKDLLLHPEKQQSLGKAAYKTIVSVWNADVAAERFLQLAQAVLDGDKSPDLFDDGPCSRAEIWKDDWY